MSLIKCMECGKEYSARAHACPNCGCPTWDTINKLYQEEQVVNICNKMYDVSEIVSNINNNISDQVSVELLSNMTGFTCGEVAYIYLEIKEGNFYLGTQINMAVLQIQNTKRKSIVEMNKLPSREKIFLIAQTATVPISKELPLAPVC